MSEVQRALAPLAALGAAVLLIALVFFLDIPSIIQPKPNQSVSEGFQENASAPECASGSRAQCTNYMNCSGYKICYNGMWSECIIKTICIPGREQACYINSCEMGYAKCNKCGSGLEQCLPRNITNSTN